MSRVFVRNILHPLPFAYNQKTVLAIGKFALFHEGHRSLLKILKKEAMDRNLHPIVFSFHPSPSYFFASDKKLVMPVFSIKARYHKLQSFFGHLDFDFFLQKFNAEFARLTPHDFIELLIARLNVHTIVVGEDFVFGNGKSGDVNILKQIAEKYGIALKVISLIRKSGDVLSSTYLRKTIEKGKIEIFNSNVIFGNYSIFGTVIHGSGIAKDVIGLKTANVMLKKHLIMPKFGVYFCICNLLGVKYNGIVNIGVKPSVGIFDPLAEVHLFHFNEDIYGHKIEIELLKLVRKEKKFDSLDALKKQVAEDVVQAKAFFDT